MTVGDDQQFWWLVLRYLVSVRTTTFLAQSRTRKLMSASVNFVRGLLSIAYRRGVSEVVVREQVLYLPGAHEGLPSDTENGIFPVMYRHGLIVGCISDILREQSI